MAARTKKTFHGIQMGLVFQCYLPLVREYSVNIIIISGRNPPSYRTFSSIALCRYYNTVYIVYTRKERRILIAVHGDLPRQHPFGTTLRFTGPVSADSRQ